MRVQRVVYIPEKYVEILSRVSKNRSQAIRRILKYMLDHDHKVEIYTPEEGHKQSIAFYIPKEFDRKLHDALKKTDFPTLHDMMRSYLVHFCKFHQDEIPKIQPKPIKKRIFAFLLPVDEYFVLEPYLTNTSQAVRNITRYVIEKDTCFSKPEHSETKKVQISFALSDPLYSICEREAKKRGYDVISIFIRDCVRHVIRNHKDLIPLIIDREEDRNYL